MDGTSSPSCMRVTIKASKTDPFRKGADLHIGLGSPPLCAVPAMMAYLSLWGNAPGSLLMLQDGCPISRVLRTDWLRQLFFRCWHNWKLFQPQFPHRCCNGCRS